MLTKPCAVAIFSGRIIVGSTRHSNWLVTVGPFGAPPCDFWAGATVVLVGLCGARC